MSSYRPLHPRRVRRVRREFAPVLVAVLATAAGCASQQSNAPDRAANPSLSMIQAPRGALTADQDRATLARFIGVWNVEGWAAGPGQARRELTGRAAAAIEDEHFVLIDLEALSGPASGRAVGKAGSMLLASEPGIGLTLTAWGDASPSITRLIGRSEGNGSVFVFNEVRTPAGVPKVSLAVTFETDDRWIAEVREVASSDGSPIASYTFTRARD